MSYILVFFCIFVKTYQIFIDNKFEKCYSFFVNNFIGNTQKIRKGEKNEILF